MGLTLALIALAGELLLILLGRGLRVGQGLTDTPTLDLDRRHALFAGARPGTPPGPHRRGKLPADPRGMEIRPAAPRLEPAQMAVYFLLIEENTGIRPPHGYLVLGGGQRVKVKNTDRLRFWILGIAEEIRSRRRQLAEPVPVTQPAAKCRSCGVREACGQRRG